MANRRKGFSAVPNRSENERRESLVYHILRQEMAIAARHHEAMRERVRKAVDDVLGADEVLRKQGFIWGPQLQDILARVKQEMPA
jgi:hypothetical protein